MAARTGMAGGIEAPLARPPFAARPCGGRARVLEGTPRRLSGTGRAPRVSSTCPPPLPPLRARRTGLLCLAVTAFGWGVNWPVMKALLREWPPLSARGWAGVTAALGLAVLAASRGERLAVPRRAVGRLLLAAAANVTAWMGLSTLCMLWLSVAEGALLVYTMPIWAALLAWPVLGERPTARGLAALALGVCGIAVLLGARVDGGPALGPEKLPGVAARARGGGPVRPRGGHRSEESACAAAARRCGVAGRARLPADGRRGVVVREAGPARPDRGRLGGDGLHDRRPDGRLLPDVGSRP